MEKYVTRRQRQELKKRRARRVFIVVIAAVLLCLMGIIILPRLSQQNRLQVPIEKNSGSLSAVDGNPEVIPDYSGEDYAIINNGMPYFNKWDQENISGEHYHELDDLGRCGTAFALLDRSMMPSGKRGEIGQIKPTGWIQKKYDGIVQSEPPYLYNRCHLIAYALTGQNANEQNLITGTRYMNANTMLSWEEVVMKYLDESDNHVLYRVSPYFKGGELLARGVEMEAYSVEDQGEGVCFHVFVYNVQPGIVLDYATGESKIDN